MLNNAEGPVNPEQQVIPMRAVVLFFSFFFLWSKSRRNMNFSNLNIMWDD